MKIKGILFAAISLFGISGVFAQGVENDDMYFNADDRAKLNAQKTTKVAYNTPEKFKEVYTEDEVGVNPTDSYSARNVNPEYTSRAHTQSAQADDEDYFVNNYQYNRNQYNNWNNNFNQWNNNPWYRSNYYGPGVNSWNSPYYGYDRYNSPWNDPYWSYNGWSSSFSYHFGNSYNYGWGGNYNYWNRPYYGWDSYGMDMYGGGGGYGMGYGGGYWNNYRYPGTIVVINNNESAGRGLAYGKRPTRGSSIVSDRSNTRSRSNVINSVRDDNNNAGGRIRTQNRKQEEYYNRNQNNSYNNSPSDNRSNTQNNRSRSWDNNDNFNNNGSTNRSSSPSYTPSRSSSSDGGGTRTNSSSTGSGGRRGRD